MHTTTIIVMQTPAEAAGVRAAAQEARNAAEQARDIARAERDAAQMQRDAAQARREAEQAGTSENVGVVTITKDGRTIVLDNASPEAVATALGMPVGDQRPESDGPYVVAGLAIVSTAFVVLAAVVMWYRTKMRGTGPGAAMPAELAQRMSRMENAIESVAVEVERISEGQRFTTRLLSDRAPLEVPRG